MPLGSDLLEEIIVDFTTSLMKKETEEEILWDLAKNCISRMGFIDCVIYQVEKDRQILVQKAAYGPKNPRDYEIYHPINIPMGLGITGYAAEKGIEVLVSDTRRDNRYLLDDEARLSELAVPIHLDGEVWGVIDCEHPDENYFTEEHLRILKAVAAICSVKIQNLKKAKALANEQKKRQQKEREFAKARMKAIKAQMNPHFLFNSLNAIQYFMIAGEKRNALKYHSCLSVLVRKQVLHLEKEFIALKEELSMVQSYFTLQKLRYEGRLRTRVEINDQLTTFRVPSMLIQLMIQETIETCIQESDKTPVEVLLEINSAKQSIALDLEVGFIEREKSEAYLTHHKKDQLSWEAYFEVVNGYRDLSMEKNYTCRKESGQVIKKFSLKLPLNTKP